MRDLTTLNIVRGKALTVGGITKIINEFPLGQGYYKLKAEIEIVVTIGTGSGAITEGELGIIKNIFFKTDEDGVVCNLNGKSLYYKNLKDSKTPPVKDAIAASSATYRVSLEIPFANMNLNRPEDTILNTARYNSIELAISLGTVADLFSTVGTSSITAAINVDVEATEGLLHEQALPLVLPYFTYMPQINPANQTYIELEKATDLAIETLMIHTANSVTAGEAFSGTGADNVISAINFEKATQFLIRSAHVRNIKQENKRFYQLATALTGYFFLPFCKDGSIFSAISTGDANGRLNLNWTNDTLSTSGVCVMLEGFRRLKDLG